MKTAALIVLWMVFIAHAHGQSFASRSAGLHCGAREIASGDEFDRVQRVSKRLLSVSTGPSVEIVLIDSKVINAWSLNLGPGQGLVCIPIGLVRWQEDADGELAFIVGHELGHAWDESCKTFSGRARLSKKSFSLGKILFGASEGDEVGDQRTCEYRADAIGLQLLARAQYRAEDAITAFQRLQEHQHDRRKGVLGRLAAMGSDHPITSDRIRRLKQLLARNLDFDTR